MDDKGNGHSKEKHIKDGIKTKLTRRQSGETIKGEIGKAPILN
jgi:hypothetical protein